MAYYPFSERRIAPIKNTAVVVVAQLQCAQYLVNTKKRNVTALFVVLVVGVCTCNSSFGSQKLAFGFVKKCVNFKNRNANWLFDCAVVCR